MRKRKFGKKKNWKLLVEYEGTGVKDKEAKRGDLEVVEVGSSKVTLLVNGKDVTDLANDRRRRRLRSIVDEAMCDIRAEFEMGWERERSLEPIIAANVAGILREATKDWDAKKWKQWSRMTDELRKRSLV